MKAALLLAAASGALAAVVPRNDPVTSDYFTTRSLTLPPVPIPTDLPTYEPPKPSSTKKSSVAPPSYTPKPSSTPPKTPAKPSSSKKPVAPSSYKPPTPTTSKKAEPSYPVPSDSIGLSVRDARDQAATTSSKKATTTAVTSVKSSSASTKPTSTKPSGSAPTQVEITGVTYGGTGCPSGSVGSAISLDRTIVTLIFDQYVASIGGGAKITESRKNCQINLALLYPGGFQYSILSADYRGYAYLDAGITGKQTSTYYFSGQSAQANTGTTWNGPYAANYYIHDTAVSASNVWSPCGEQALLNINSQIALTSTNSTGQGLLTNDSIDLNFKQQIYIQWRAC